MKDLRDLFTEFYIEDKNSVIQYILELELIIHFQLLIVLTAFSTKVNEIMLHNNLINSKSVELKAYGINFRIEEGGKTLAERYSHIVKEISKLDHIQRMRFENIKEEYEIELKQQRLKRKQTESEEKKALEQRMQNIKTLYEQHKQKQKEQANQNNIPIDEMIDSIEKYQKIVEKYKNDGVKFVDKQFTADNKSLGTRTIGNTAGWVRAEGCVLYDKEPNAVNVKQGAIGDCYYLSAISVLGPSRVKKIFVNSDPDPLCGAYLMQFYRYGDPIFVIVDDFFPINAEKK
jgi:Calpain family cysteine protease.